VFSGVRAAGGGPGSSPVGRARAELGRTCSKARSATSASNGIVTGASRSPGLGRGTSLASGDLAFDVAIASLTQPSGAPP